MGSKLVYFTLPFVIEVLTYIFVQIFPNKYLIYSNNQYILAKECHKSYMLISFNLNCNMVTSLFNIKF